MVFCFVFDGKQPFDTSCITDMRLVLPNMQGFKENQLNPCFKDTSILPWNKVTCVPTWVSSQPHCYLARYCCCDVSKGKQTMRAGTPWKQKASHFAIDTKNRLFQQLVWQYLLDDS